jgi:FkbM family methyltransferase
MKKIYFDVGANDGNSMSGYVNRSDSLIFAFEPTPRMIEVLKGKYGHLPNYRIIEKAVSNYDGKATFNVVGNADWGCSSLCEFQKEEILKRMWPGRTDFRVTDKIEVEVIRLETFIDQLQHEGLTIEEIELWNCTAQGCELEALMGMGKHIHKIKNGTIKIPMTHESKLYNQKYIYEDALKFLDQNNFRVSHTVNNDRSMNENRVFFSRLYYQPQPKPIILTQNIRKLKIAIVFTGRLIVDPVQYQNFCNYFMIPLSNFEVDIIVSHCKGYDQKRIQQFTGLYKPKKIEQNEENYPDVQKYRCRAVTNKNNVMCMYKSRRNALRLLEEYIEETNQSYDIVISSRSDLFFSSLIPFTQFTQPGIHIPSGFDYTGLNDQCAFGPFDDMKTYLNLYDEIIPLLESGVKFHPETLLKVYLERKQKVIRRFNTTYLIKRYGKYPNFL